MVNQNACDKFSNNIADIVEAQKGNEEALEKLVLDNQGLLWSIVKRFNGRGYETDDLYQIASLGFLKCIKRFDTNFNVRLSTYAVPYILGEIKRYIQEDGIVKVSRSLKELNAKIAFVQKEYFRRFGRDIKLEEIAKELGVSKEEIAMALDSKNPVNSIYETSGTSEEGQCIIDTLASEDDEQLLITNKITITKLISDLTEKEKQIIILRYYRGKTQTEISKIIGVSQVQVSRIEKRILEKMKEDLSEDLLEKRCK